MNNDKGVEIPLNDKEIKIVKEIVTKIDKSGFLDDKTNDYKVGYLDGVICGAFAIGFPIGKKMIDITLTDMIERRKKEVETK